MTSSVRVRFMVKVRVRLGTDAVRGSDALFPNYLGKTFIGYLQVISTRN